MFESAHTLFDAALTSVPKTILFFGDEAWNARDFITKKSFVSM